MSEWDYMRTDNGMADALKWAFFFAVGVLYGYAMWGCKP